MDRQHTSPAHMVLVNDEYGHFEGIITPMDVLEAVAGWMQVDEFADLLSLKLDADREYETVAGLVLYEVGHLSEVGQRLELQGWTVEVVDLDGHRIDKLLVSRSG